MSHGKKLLDLNYICPGGMPEGSPLIFCGQVDFVKHTSVQPIEQLLGSEGLVTKFRTFIAFNNFISRT